MADFNVGSIDASLGFDYESAGADRWEKKLDTAQARARKPVVAQLKADLDSRGFDAYERRLNSTHVAAARLAGGLKSLGKQAALITAAGIGIQAISALGGAAVAATSSLGPLVGVMGALPGAASAAGQGLGVFKLATANIFDAVGGLNEKLVESNKAFRELDPQAQKIARRLDDMKKPIRDLQGVAQRGLFPGVERGINGLQKLLPILRPLVRGTAEALGDMAAEAGSGLAVWGPDLERQGQRNIRWMKDGGAVVGSLANALRHLTIAAGPLTSWLFESARGLADYVESATEAGRKSGSLARFFEETRVTVARVGHVLTDLSVGLRNIGVISYNVLGRRMLKDLRDVSGEFRQWTESARGRNDIKQYFDDARPGIYALFRLIDGVTRAFFRLGRGDQVAPLLDTITEKLVPAFETLIDQTTKTFGPVLLDFLEQAVILFTHLAGDSGPLHAFVSAMADILRFVNKLLDAFPALNSAIVSLAALGGIAKALQIGAAITGVGKLIGLLKTARGVAAGAAVAEGAAGAAGGAAAARGAAGGAAAGGVLSRVPGPAKAIAAAIAGGVLLSQHNRGREERESDDRMNRLIGQIKEIGRSSRTVAEAQDRLRAFRDQWREVADLPGKPKAWREYYDGVVDSADAAIRKLAQGELDQNVRETNQNIRRNWRRLRDDSESTFTDVRQQVRATGHMIKARLGEDSEAGKEALAKNFRQAARAVKQQMDASGKTTKEGLGLIERYMARALESYGISPGTALSIARHGDIKGPSRGGGNQDLRTPQRGGWIRRAVGGWIGGRGMVSDDIVPIAPNVIAALGEYDAVGPGNRRAVINRHQAPPIEAALAMGGYPSLDALPPGGQLPIIERALGGPHVLDQLFSMVNRPHMMQGGGIVPVPGFPGERANQSILGEIAAIVRRFHLTLTDAYGQGHKSPGHTRFGTAADFAGPDKAMDAAVRYLVRRGYVVGYDGRFGSQAWPGHGPSYVAGRNAHLHVELGGPGAIAAMVDRIRTPVVHGGGTVGSVVQGALRMATGAANRAVRRAAEASLAVPVAGGRGVGAANAGIVRRWIAAGLRLAGQRATPGAISTLFGRVMQESRGDPNAINKWDINAQRGDPSIGLLQTTGSTFRRYAVRGHTSIRNPIDNVAAAVRYMLATYGHLVGAGSGGYSLGGRIGRMLGMQPGGRIPSTPLFGGRPIPSVLGQPTMGVTKLRFRAKTNSSIRRYNDIMGDVEDLGKRYELTDRKYNQTDEQLLNDDGTVNKDAVEQRVAELGELIRLRERIQHKLEQAREVARRVVKNLTGLIRQLTRSLRFSRGKDRRGVISKINDARTQLDEFAGIVHDIRYDIEGAGLDVQDLRLEQQAVRDTTASDTAGAIATEQAEATVQSERARADALAKENAALTATVRTFQSSGDIGAGYINASGSVSGGVVTGGGPTSPLDQGQTSLAFVQNNYMLTPDDPAVLRGVASAAVSGFSQQPFRAATRESYNV